MAAIASRSAGEPVERRVFAHGVADVPVLIGGLVAGLAPLVVTLLAPRGAFAAIAVIAYAIVVVWASNTIAHIHLHKPIFAARAANVAFSLLLSLGLFVPQTLWTQRHLAHHAAAKARVRLTSRMAVEIALILAASATLGVLAPWTLATVLAPGWLIGLALCQAQGYFEHGGDTYQAGISHYGRIHNALWFNDGHHAEHHRFPQAHWTELPQRRFRDTTASALPPLLRMFERGVFAAIVLGALEGAVLRVPFIQRWLVRVHANALRTVVARFPRQRVRSVAIVGGGLFPRSLLALREVFPDAKHVVIDASVANLKLADDFLRARGETLPVMIPSAFDPAVHRGFDLVVFPLAFVGDRGVMTQAARSNGLVLVHDWLWNRGRHSALVSLLLLKCLRLQGAVR